MTDLFVTVYTYSIMDHINTDDTYFSYQSTCFVIAKMYESLMEQKMGIEFVGGTWYFRKTKSRIQIAVDTIYERFQKVL